VAADDDACVRADHENGSSWSEEARWQLRSQPKQCVATHDPTVPQLLVVILHLYASRRRLGRHPSRLLVYPFTVRTRFMHAIYFYLFIYPFFKIPLLSTQSSPKRPRWFVATSFLSNHSTTRSLPKLPPWRDALCDRCVCVYGNLRRPSGREDPLPSPPDGNLVGQVDAPRPRRRQYGPGRFPPTALWRKAPFLRFISSSNTQRIEETRKLLGSPIFQPVAEP
jgi:hypothetical protein